MNVVPCCVLILCADTIWYVVFCARSFHFNVLSLTEPASKSSNVGNDGAGSLKRLTNSARASFESVKFIVMISSS